jgi:protein-disulfide isomerase
LENLVTRAVLEAEAKKRGISVEELRKTLAAGSIEVSVPQVEALYQENASAFGSMSPDEAKERLRLDLESQGRMRNYRAAFAALRTSMKIKMQLEEPRLPPNASNGGGPSLGPDNAAVTIVEFSDFQCPYCREVQAVVKQIVKEYPNDVRMTFKHLPLDIHDRAFAAAQAAFCADEQKQFWPYHDALFTANDLSIDTLNRFATKTGLNVEKFKSCLASDVSRAGVMSDLQEARRLGVNSTPTFVVNGKLVRGNLGLAEFKQLVERELTAANNHSSLDSLQQPREKMNR